MERLYEFGSLETVWREAQKRKADRGQIKKIEAKSCKVLKVFMQFGILKSFRIH